MCFISQAINRAKAHRLERGEMPVDMSVDLALESDEDAAPLAPPTRGRGRGARGRGSRGRGRGELMCYLSQPKAQRDSQ